MIKLVKNKRQIRKIENKKNSSTNVDQLSSKRKHTFTAFHNSRSRQNLSPSSMSRVSTAKRPRNLISPIDANRVYEFHIESIENKLPQLEQIKRRKLAKRSPTNLNAKRK